jgi:tRNA dimethylallyltransferase
VPLSALQGRRAASSEALGTTVRIALVPSDRKRLHDVIARRFDAMLAAGLVEEVRSLRQRYELRADLPSMRCVGYRQAWEYLDGAIDAPTLRTRAIAATRQLAKRQFTWLRATEATALDPFASDVYASLLALVASAGGADP